MPDGKPICSTSLIPDDPAAVILASLHMQTADDLFGNPAGTPRTDKLIEASIQWAKRIMQKIDGETKFTSSD